MPAQQEAAPRTRSQEGESQSTAKKLGILLTIALKGHSLCLAATKQPLHPSQNVRHAKGFCRSTAALSSKRWLALQINIASSSHAYACFFLLFFLACLLFYLIAVL